MAKAAAGGGGADSSVADELRALGVKGVLVQMAERGQLLALKCEMPQCYHHKGRGAFDPITTPPTRWAPSRDHYPILKSAGGVARRAVGRAQDESGAPPGRGGAGSPADRCSQRRGATDELACMCRDPQTARDAAERAVFEHPRFAGGGPIATATRWPWSCRRRSRAA
jgi:hypothetical protein